MNFWGFLVGLGSHKQWFGRSKIENYTYLRRERGRCLINLVCQTLLSLWISYFSLPASCHLSTFTDCLIKKLPLATFLTHILSVTHSQTKWMQDCVCQKCIENSSHRTLAAEATVSKKQCWLTVKKCMLTNTNTSTSKLFKVMQKREVAPNRQAQIFSLSSGAIKRFVPCCES